jgi:hypothetical protein
MSRKPDVRVAMFCGLVRRELGIRAADAALAIGRSRSAVETMESGTYDLSATGRLLQFYGEEFERRGVQVEPCEGLPLRQMVERLAVGVLRLRVARATELLAAFDRGADEVVMTLVSERLDVRRVCAVKMARKMRDRLAYERAREA